MSRPELKTQPAPYVCGQWLRAEDRHCGQAARLYPGGWLCFPHSPGQANRPQPPKREEPAMRERSGPTDPLQQPAGPLMAQDEQRTAA
ncbi:hypothetical protein [Kitasatospora sp. NPDC090091]|uniref:hypothetical protein n=1 Tax=Kitasatospora sp. NPDC090091 TaxID=3364081 RepID=UPI00382405A7